jgi:hypothetical protein
MRKYLLCLIIIGFIIISGCTGCVKNECKKVITPIVINEYSLTIVDSEGVRYEARDKYVIGQLKINQSNVVTYIDGSPKLIVTVY